MTITLRNVDFETLQVIESLKGLKKDLEIEKIPNDETLEAMRECEEILANPHKYKSYHSAKELIEDCLND